MQLLLLPCYALLEAKSQGPDWGTAVARHSIVHRQSQHPLGALLGDARTSRPRFQGGMRMMSDD